MAAPAATPIIATVAATPYVENLLLARYAEFVARGGESESVRPARLRLIEEAIKVRTIAEQAAGLDDRAVAWVRPLVDQADTLRRQAEDRLFATNASAFDTEPPCTRLLDEARKLYEQARDLGHARIEALDLVERLEDELPYYGDWLACRRSAITAGSTARSPFEEILTRTIAIANLAHSPVPTDANRDQVKDDLIALTLDLQSRVNLLANSARDAARALIESGDWQELDAILRLPGIAVKDRMALLDRLASGELSPSLTLSDVPDDTNEPPARDRAFWAKAVDLARVEIALLTIAGQDTESLTPWIDAAELAATGDRNDEALEKLALFAGKARQVREAMVQEVVGLPLRIDPDGPNAVQVRAAGRAARVMPLLALQQLPADSDPVQLTENLDRRDLTIWHARRLCEDFALRQARQVLTSGRGGLQRTSIRLKPGEGYWEVDALQQAYASASIDVEIVADERQVRFKPAGKLPEGEAVAFDGHGSGDSAPPMLKRVPGNAAPGSLLPVNAPEPVAFAFERSSPQPVAFFRGRAFTPRLALKKLDDVNLVDVSIRERTTTARIGGRKVTWVDQFEKHPNEGYLHPVNSLVYKIRLSSESEQPLMLYVTYGFDDVPDEEPKVAVLTLPPHQVDETIVGEVLPDDLELDKPRTMSVRVTEGDPQGRKLSEDLNVAFQKIEPKEIQDIKVNPAFDRGVVYLDVQRSSLDRITGPVLIYVMVEPFNLVRQLNDPYPYILPGRFVRYAYQMSPAIEDVEFTFEVDEIEVCKKKYQINPKKKPPPQPAAGAGVGLAAGN